MNPLALLHISPGMLRLLSELDEFKGRWTALDRLAPDRLHSLRKVATIESIGSSTRIEGAKLSNSEIEALLSGVAIYSFRSRDEQEVAGYAEAMELVFNAFAQIHLTENHIKQLHGALLKHSEKDSRHRGEYKKLTNDVVAKDETGEVIGVVFETATPFDTPRLMEALVGWMALELGEKPSHHPLLVIAVFVVRFLAIHPFQDGNGRLSRVLTTLLLLRAGYAYVPYSSHERIIEANKADYYKALRAAQQTLDRDEAQLDVWIDFFLQTLIAQKNILAAKIDEIDILQPLSALSEQILQIAKDHGRVTVADATKLTLANANTIKKHLANLVKADRLVRHGKGRGTWYSV